MDSYHMANLTDEQVKELKNLEKELGVVLIAYENESKKDGEEEYYKQIFCE